MLAPHRSALRVGRVTGPAREDPRSGLSLKWFKSRPGVAQQNSLHPQNRPVEGRTRKGIHMSQPLKDDPNEPVPWMQQLLDNPFLLLFLGVMIPMLVYTVWGVIDILTIPLAK
jgi:hypothetical protein